MWKQILKTGLLAGLLDISAAFLQGYLTSGISPAIILKYIASGVLGKEAFSGGYEVMALGLLFHFIIAFACTIIFFFLYPKIKFLHKSVLLNSVLIGLTAWAVTTRIVIPLSSITPGAFDLKKAMIAVGILIVCIGLPIAVMTKSYYTKKA